MPIVSKVSDLLNTLIFYLALFGYAMQYFLVKFLCLFIDLKMMNTIINGAYVVLLSLIVWKPLNGYFDKQ